jgi:uncharacterized protein (DUF362 family)
MFALGAPGLRAADADKPTQMTIARWAGQGKPAADAMKDIAVKLTEKAIEGMGGMKRFVKNGDVVWIKPNIGWDRTPEQAANTNPDVVATLIKLCLDAGAKTIKIGDNPVHAADKSYKASGIAAVAKELGAEVIFLDKTRFKDTDIKGERVKSIPIFPGILECDVVINVPVVKHHRLAEMTACMKNYMGVIEKRQTFHQGFGACLSDISRFMQPRAKLIVVDALRVLKANGPLGGRLEDVDVKTTVAAGVDIVALDSLSAELMGKKGKDVKTVEAGEKAGLGTIDYRSLALRELSVS